jgi:hypothetical protein
MEPGPFPPQRLGLWLPAEPKPVTARLRVVAATGARPAAPLVGASAERPQQIALRAPDQIDAHPHRPREPLFEREPPGKASRICRSSLHGLVPLFVITVLLVTTGLDPVVHGASQSRRRSKLHLRHSAWTTGSSPAVTSRGDDELFHCRDAPSHPSFADAKKSQAKKAFPKTPPLKEGRRSADRRTTGPHRQAMRRAPCLLFLEYGRTEARILESSDLMERARSPFGAPPRLPRSCGPRLGFGRASWNHRMQTGGPSPAPVQRAPRGPTRAGRDDASAARGRSVSLRPREPPPLRRKEYPRDKASFVERDFA